MYTYSVGNAEHTKQYHNRKDYTMINTRTSKNKDWSIGATVKVGFLTLKVVDIQAVNDGLPDIYTLSSLNNTKHYHFIPHNGLTRVF
jgi:hypothetical protein